MYLSSVHPFRQLSWYWGKIKKYSSLPEMELLKKYFNQKH